LHSTRWPNNAKTDKEAGHRGISAFVVPRDETVAVDKHEDKMGLRASNTAVIRFNETEVPAGNLLGDENHGFKLAMMALDRARPGVAAMATGIAQAAFEFATETKATRSTLQSSHAKRFAADMAMKVTTDAVQIYGGYGFIKDYPVEKLMRDAKIMQL
jgi:acyl-CoA dehydrogenase